MEVNLLLILHDSHQRKRKTVLNRNFCFISLFCNMQAILIMPPAVPAFSEIRSSVGSLGNFSNMETTSSAIAVIALLN